MDTNKYFTTIFPDPAFTKIGEDIGVAVCTTSVGDMRQHFVYGFESYSGSTMALNTGCFPHEVAVLVGIAQARLLCWDGVDQCGDRF